MDINKADKLLKSYLEGTCTAEERQLVENWYDETLRIRAKIPDLDNEILANIALRERLKAYMDKEAPNRLGQRLRFLGAAVALIMVFAAYYLYIGKTTETQIHESDLLVDATTIESNGATLKLAGGEMIQLRSDQGIVIDTSVLVYSDGSRIIPEKIQGGSSPILELSTTKGGQYQIDLSDGSRVWLNASSTLTFPKEFGNSERRVELIGEAYFEIAHDKKKPFKVITNLSLGEGQMVEVLGTKFNIDAYEENQAIKTTLLEGSVKVRASAFEASKVLKPHQQSVIRADRRVIAAREVNVENVMAWRKGDFIFDDEDLESIMHKVSRWYDVDVSYEYKPKGLYYNGAISRSRDLSAVLQALEETGQVEFKINGRKITVMQGKEKR